ncbi:ribosomal maturation YjgA family protein [Streptomyces sp. RKAG337]|uniref:ribosomal maturation YjgA family protein n=1 Tax=Streptomyces sp. RKAG337 TaxID=2893404 RepID=UPI0020341771|nr:DUF2809 domain-containing protein [Streptomyces sp. RKAG337]MCM2424387.1 DUF2809 domain-containing protein [Streptomyces sp. RKAG337]
MNDSWRRGGPLSTRLLAAGAAVLTVAVALGIRAGATGATGASGVSGAVGKYAGDALYTVLLHALVVLAVPRVRPLVAAAVALGVSWAVEFSQLSTVPGELSARSTLARLVLGSTFNAPDLFWYAVGAVSGWFVHAMLNAFSSRRTVGVVREN